MMFDAMPMMAAAAPAPAPEIASAAPPTAQAVRKYFPETWKWECSNSGFVHSMIWLSLWILSFFFFEFPHGRPLKNFKTKYLRNFSTGSVTLNEVAPDTITSWYLTGFATNNEYGLGVTDDKTVFKVFKKFFVSLNLPYSVKRGEAVLIQIVVFNYLPKTVTAKVTLDNSRKQFEFVDPHTQAYKDKGCPLGEDWQRILYWTWIPNGNSFSFSFCLAIDSSRSKTVTVNANDGVSLSFLVTPLIIGPMLIKVIWQNSKNIETLNWRCVHLGCCNFVGCRWCDGSSSSCCSRRCHTVQKQSAICWSQKRQKFHRWLNCWHTQECRSRFHQSASLGDR